MPTAHPPETRAKALELAAAGQTHGAIGRELDVGQSTISEWCKAAGVRSAGAEKTAAAREVELARRAVIREELRTEYLQKALAILKRMDEPQVEFKGNGAQQVEYPRPTPSGCYQLAMASAVMLDKFRLEVGEPTDRHEVSDDRDRAYDDARERAHTFRLVANN